MMTSINWPAPSVWVFIVQLLEHCSANAEAMGSNRVEAFRATSQMLNLRFNCDGRIFISGDLTSAVILSANQKSSSV